MAHQVMCAHLVETATHQVAWSKIQPVRKKRKNAERRRCRGANTAAYQGKALILETKCVAPLFGSDTIELGLLLAHARESSPIYHKP